MSKKLLIACYFFPPCPSIGGRRSAKFAKYLAKDNNEVHVIQAINPFSTTSAWLKDIDNEKNVHRHELPLHYPVEFIIPPKTITGKIKYRFYTLYFDLFQRNKNRYDYTIFWENAYLKKAEELIKKHGIKNILVSGPPFYYAHQTLKLKDKFPGLNVIIDFRDPWIGSPYYGMSSLKEEQKAYEIKLLNEVYSKADYFIGPNTFLLKEQLTYIFPGTKNGAKIVEVPHGFDHDELAPFLESSPERKNSKIRLVYGGQLYPGTESILTELNKMLSHLKKESGELYNKLEFNFYTPETDKAKYFLENKEIVNFYKPVGNEIMSKIAEADMCLIFLAEHNKDFRTTKFLEYSVLRKPFIVFGNKGYVARFVEENKLGKAYDESTVKEFSIFLNALEIYLAREYNRGFDFSGYEFGKITQGLESILI